MGDLIEGFGERRDAQIHAEEAQQQAIDDAKRASLRQGVPRIYDPSERPTVELRLESLGMRISGMDADLKDRIDSLNEAIRKLKKGPILFPVEASDQDIEK